MSELMQAFRRWWFNNEGGLFQADNGISVNRADVFRYGGPAPDFVGCPICQSYEWHSRLKQKPTWPVEHQCPTSQTAWERCEKQGDERWTNYHQDHSFAWGVDPALNAPKVALLLQDCASQYEWFKQRNCSAGLATFRQRMACVGTCNPEARLVTADWRDYDWAWLVNKGFIELHRRPEVPLVLYCHDAWRGNKQEVLDHYRPEVLMTPFPTLWRENFRIPDATRLEFMPTVQSPFFAKPNLDPERKKWDLLVIGALGSDFYAPRRALNEQLASLPSRFRVEHSHEVGSHRARWFGPLDDDKHCYMNFWLDKLGASRFVIFGPCAGRAASMALIKYYECLCSGAVPIMPRLVDTDALGLVPMVHYIPFALVQDDNATLAEFLDHYDEYRHIAENAVAWWRENIHDLAFGRFERMVRTLTGARYPAREL